MAKNIGANLPLVLVEWLDANTDNEPVTEDNVSSVHRPYVIHTLGWVLQHDDIGITLCNEFYLDSYRGRTFIPAGMIVHVTPYNLARPRQPRRTPVLSEPTDQ
jgi:hypothetical protein